MRWTLFYVPTVEVKTFEEWGIGGLTRTLINQGRDIVTFTQPGSYDADPIFAEDSTVIIARGDTLWFYGRVIGVARQGDGANENIVYEVAGPWWYLEQLVFQQTWKNLRDQTDPTSVRTFFKSHLLLNWTLAGAKLNTGQQIKEAVDYCIAAGAPMVLDPVGLPTLDVAIDEVTDITCAEVIIRQLRYSPDIVAFFDYSTAPVPTLRFKSRDLLPAVSLPVPADISRVSIKARQDLTTPAVVIIYERTNQVNGAGWSYDEVDAWPVGEVGTKFGSIVATVNLEGAVATVASGSLVCGAILPDDVEWWKARENWLSKETVQNISIKNAKRSSVLPNQILNGVFAEWMPGRVEEDVVTAQISYEVKNQAGEVIEIHQDEEISVRVQATNLVTKNYQSVTDFTPAEPTPIGMAKAIYLAANNLQFDGQIELVEDEVSSTAGMGNLVNISGGRAEWEKMAAQVTQITENVDAGQTLIILGPKKHLGRDDIMALLRVNRTRLRYTSPARRSTGKTASSLLELGSKTAKQEVARGAGSLDKIVIGGAIQLARDDLPVLPDGSVRALKVREMPYCERQADGSLKERKILVPASEVYD